MKMLSRSTLMMGLLLVMVTFALAACSDDGDSHSDGDAPDGDGTVDGDDPSDGDTPDGDMPDDGDIDGDGGENPYVEPKDVVIYYEHDPNDPWSQGRMFAVVVYNFLGHFATNVTIENIEDYEAGDIDDYDAAIYIASSYDVLTPSAFLDDVYTHKHYPVFWMGYHIPRFFESGAYDGETRFGFRFTEHVEGEVFETVTYKNTEIIRDAEDVYFMGIEVVDEDRCETVAYMKNDQKTRPYMIHCGAFWYMINVPFSYMAPDVNIFADALHDFLRTDLESNHRALLRIEDVNVGSADQTRLRELADILSERNIPFSVGVTPVYSDPEGVFFEPGSTFKMSDYPDFINTLKYLKSKGATLILHGYSHQFDGITGEDFEFWDEQQQTPVADDNWEWAEGRVKAAKQEFSTAMGYTPTFWETPHYEASYLDYFAIASVFDTVYERFRVFDTLDKAGPSNEMGSDMEFTIMPAPYMLYNSYYGFSIIPENCGYIDSGKVDEYGIPENAEGKRYYAQQIKMVRDGVASFFFHAWQPTEELLGSIEAIQDEGFRFVSPGSLKNDGPPAYLEDIIVDGDADGDSDGDVDGDGDDPGFDVCLVSARECPAGQGCRLGFCGACDDATQCRNLEGCSAEGVCGVCAADAECRAGETCRQGWCMPGEIEDFEVTLEAGDLAQLLDEENAWDDLTFPCTVKVGGVAYDTTAEIRLYGNSSRNYPKKAFRIEFPEDAEHPGFSRKINLKADYNDPASMRSFVSFEIIRQLSTIPTPRTRYRRLYLNGEYYGLMTEIERIGGKFLEVNGRDRDQSLYEASEAFITGAFVAMPDMETYIDFYQKKAGDELNYTDLITFIEDILWTDYLNSPSWTDTVMTLTEPQVHMDSYIKFLALMVVIQNIDEVESNFHFSWQADRNGDMGWEFYPWDMDISLGCKYDSDIQRAYCINLEYEDWYQAGILYEGDPEPIYPNDVWFNMLMHLTMNHQTYLPQFERQICEYIGGDFYNDRLPKLIEAVYETIKPSVLEDTNDMNESEADFLAAKQGILDYLGNRKTYLSDPWEVGCGGE